MRVIILCGGSGSRLWPESRESLPKQFISLSDTKSLLDLTVERVFKIIQKTKPIFICNKKHGFLVKKTIEKYEIEADIFLEPEGKNTCAAIYLAAKYCHQNDNLLILPSDHLISNKKTFLNDISIIEKKINPKQWITLGIKPTKPSEAYGYIKVLKNDKSNFKKVLNFVEKPSKKVASKFIKSGDYYWNAGIFIAKANHIIESIKKNDPEIARHCDKSFNEIIINKKTSEIGFTQELYSRIPSRSIDYAVMEKDKNIFLYPLNSEWNDVGSWDSISETNNKEPGRSTIIQVDSDSNFIRNKKRIIATIGIQDLIIIDSDDATLICKKNHSEKVKQVVKELSEKNLTQGKEHSFEHRPWGKFENLLEDKFCKVKKIIVYPKKRLSLQYHNLRSEHWLIVSGTANVHLDGKDFILLPGQSIDIPTKSHHYIENAKNEDLIVIETQLGSYFGEDDIIRLDDPYLR